MLRENVNEFARCNVLEYHEAGIMGAGKVAAVLDDGCPPGAYMPYVETPLGTLADGDHSSQVCRVAHEYVPLARVISLPYIGQPLATKLASIAWIEINRPDVVICSFHEGAGDHFRRLIATGIPIFCASGNQDSEEHVAYPARYPETIAVGALEEYRNLVAGYSNWGPELNCIAYTDICIPTSDDIMSFNGTSCAAPSAAGLFLLYSEAMGSRFDSADAVAVVRNSCIDYYAPGHDWQSGWGLFVLPKMEVPVMRDINLLHPDLQPKVLKLIELCKAKNINIIITQTMRSESEQNALYAQGRSLPGAIVTNARYPVSLHCWGISFDVAILLFGKAAYPVQLLDIVGMLGESIGLEWGGRWTGFVDRPHFQLPGFEYTALVRQYSTPTRFVAAWAEAKKVEVAKVAGFEGPAKIVYNGQSIPGGILEGRTYGELKALVALLGKTLVWDNVTKTATIK